MRYEARSAIKSDQRNRDPSKSYVEMGSDRCNVRKETVALELRQHCSWEKGLHRAEATLEQAQLANPRVGAAAATAVSEAEAKFDALRGRTVPVLCSSWRTIF